MMIRQRGFTLLELLSALGISGLLLVAGAQLVDTRVQDIKDQATAQYQLMINTAASRYIAANFSTVVTGSTSTSPYKVTFSTLQTAGYIPSGYTSTNPYNQTPCVLALQPVANTIETLVVEEGGQAIPVGRLPGIATQIGAAGGWVPPNGYTINGTAYTGVTALGAYGKWTKSTANYTGTSCSGTAFGSGNIASFLAFDNSSITQNYLYRAPIPGNPSANAMTAPLKLVGLTVSTGSACGNDTAGNAITQGTLASDSNGKLLVCDSTLTWTSPGGSPYWISPSTNFASSPTCSATTQWQTSVVETPTVGSGPRAYTCDGTTWKALAVNDSGNLVIGNTAVGSAISGTATGTVATGTLELKTLVTVGGACTTTGAVATTATGAVVSCNGTQWTASSNNYICTCPTADVLHWDPTSGQLWIQTWLNTAKPIQSSSTDVTGTACGTWTATHGYDESVNFTLQAGSSQAPVSRTWQCAKP